MQRVRSIVKD
jgi:hypothetical protein